MTSSVKVYFFINFFPIDFEQRVAWARLPIPTKPRSRSGKYCFENGKFTFKGTMKEMIEVCVPHMVAANPNINEKEARKIMFEWFPTLKRWKK